MSVHIRRWMSLALLGVAMTSPQAVLAQGKSFTACSTGPLANCAGVNLTSQLGAGPGGTNSFQIGLQNLGSATPSLATSMYYLVLSTGHDAADELDYTTTPTALGGATVSDASSWSIADFGDVLVLPSPANFGIGGCVASAPLGGYGQMANTCGVGAWVTFTFFTARTFDVSAFSIADIEFVAIANGNVSDSCTEDTACNVTELTTTPEPASILLTFSGFAAIAGIRRRRRSSSTSTEVSHA